MIPAEKFSNLQWYLAHAHNTVHFSAYFSDVISEQEFGDIVDQMIVRAPQLLWRENLSENRHERVLNWQRENHIQYLRLDTLPAFSQTLTDSARKLEQCRGPAFMASCHVSDQPDGTGRQSFICVTTSHALMEGADLSSLTRAKAEHKISVNEREKSAPIMQRIGASIIAPIFGLFHLLGANLQRENRTKFRFSSLSAPSNQMRNLAKSMGISQRALLFALVLFYLRTGKEKKNRMIAYSSLKDDHIAQESDGFLKLKMHILFVKKSAEFEPFARSLDAQLTKQKSHGNFNQHIYNKTLGFHRTIYPLLKPLFSNKFFSYVPYDLVLSLLPAVRPDGKFSIYNDVPIYGSSLTGKGENCIIVPGKDHLTFNLWLKQETKLDDLQAALEAMGIDSVITE